VVGSTSTTAPDSARTSYDFYSVYWVPSHGPRITTIELAPLVWDIDGGNSSPDVLQNHGTGGGNVSFADGHGEWQPVNEWDHTNPSGAATFDWPHPANQFYQ
jgi:prepilin-type processing-associated H-X9-DG protein